MKRRKWILHRWYMNSFSFSTLISHIIGNGIFRQLRNTSNMLLIRTHGKSLITPSHTQLYFFLRLYRIRVLSKIELNEWMKDRYSKKGTKCIQTGHEYVRCWITKQKWKKWWCLIQWNLFVGWRLRLESFWYVFTANGIRLSAFFWYKSIDKLF